MRARAPFSRWIATLLIVAQVVTPVAWAQTSRSTNPAPPAVDAKGPPPPAPAKGSAVDRRLALVVGNNNYKNAPLVNPINDARLVAETLKGLGFEVILRENLNLRDFKAVMRQFASRMEVEEGTALLYYAGHGVQIEGRNFLLPVDVATGDEYEVRDESVDLEEALMSRLARARKRERIIVLDACRDNPFRAPNQQKRALLARGFAQMGSEKGSLVVYSTNPGNTAEDGTGKNSLFTEKFVLEIQKEGVEVSQALRAVTSQVVSATKGRQTPWYNSSLLGDFYFRPINQRVEEERRKKELQAQIEAAVKAAKEDAKRDEAARIESMIAAKEKERQEREKQYTQQIADMKALLERRDKDLESARVQVASAAKNRDEQLAALAAAETERRRVDRDREATAIVSASAQQSAQAAAQAREAAVAADAARKAADNERLAREKKERDAAAAQVSAERTKLIRLEADLRAAEEKAAREESDRQAKAAAELARREAAAKAAREKAERDERALAEAQRKAAERAQLAQSEAQRKAAERDQLARADAARKAAQAEAQRKAAERDQLAQVETERKAAAQAKRDEAARLARANAEKLAALDEQAKQNAAKERAAQEALAKRQQGEAAGSPRDAAIRLADQKLKRAKEDAERAQREAETSVRLAQIEEDVRRKAAAELELLNRKASLPPELAALMISEAGKVVVTGSTDYFVRGIRLPADVAVKTPASNVPANCAAFGGAWGQGRWNGERSAEIWVESVEPDCRAKAIYARGGLGMTGEQATFLRGDARISGNTLTLDLSGGVRIELSRDGDRASGKWSSGVNSASAQFARIPAVPDRGVTLFANEAADFGVRPSRVISASQISTNERTRIETMLPLPTAVPGVDTLTTLQLRAFLDKHPETVLLDAFVGATHRTLPGAVWLPDLGAVQVGQKERSQIEAAIAQANGGDLSRPIVVFERSSTYGWFGYHAVLRLLGMGYTNIYWYRGGLDAWHDAQLPLAQAETGTRAR